MRFFTIILLLGFFWVWFLVFLFRKAELSFIFVFWNIPVQTWNKNSRNNLQKNVFVKCINTKASYAPPRTLYILWTMRGPRKHTKLTIFIKSQELEYRTQVLNCFAEIPTSYTVSLSLSACFSASSLPFP